MSGPLVTVVTPSLNQAEFLEQTILSVLGQDYPHIEYIIVDGGSTDGSVEIIKRYADRIAWWVTEPDAGQSDAINKGLSRSHGDVVTWLCSDDVYTPGAVSESVGYLESHPDADMVYGDVEMIDAAGQPITVITGLPFDMKRVLTEPHRIPQPTMFLRRSAMERVGLLRADLHYMMDLEWWLRIVVSGGRLDYLPGVRARIRLHGGAKTVAARPGFYDDWRMILDWFFSLPDLPDEWRSWRREAYSNVAIYHGRALLDAGRRREAIRELWRGIRLYPLRPRTLLALLMILDGVTGLRTWYWATALKRRLQGEEPDLWRQLSA